MSNFDKRPQYIEVAHISKKCYTYLELYYHKDGAVCIHQLTSYFYGNKRL